MASMYDAQSLNEVSTTNYNTSNNSVLNSLLDEEKRSDFASSHKTELSSANYNRTQRVR